MSIYNKWVTGAKYNFNSVPQGILPNRYSMVTLEGVATYGLAMMIGGGDVYSQWRKIYPSIASQGIVDDPEQYQWLTFKATNGETTVLAAPWIEGNSVVPVQFRQEQFTLTNTTDAEIAQVKLFLDALGAQYTNAPI